jgi:hypothetical protein
METIIKISKSFAIATLVLGIIHVIATYTPLIQDTETISSLQPGSLKAYIFFSLFCGGFLILGGLISWMLLKKLEQFQFLIFPILTISVFCAVEGILAVVYMFDNPFSWIVLLLELGNLITVSLLKQHCRQK